MFQRARAILMQVDWWLIGAMGCIITIGLLIQYSSGLAQDVPSLSVFWKQLVAAAIGFTGFLLLQFFDYRILGTHPYVYFATAVILLFAVLLFGTEINGTTGWFILGPISLQPVEFVKVLFILTMSAMFAERPEAMQTGRYAIASGALAGIAIGLVILQPDLGSALIIFAIWFGYVLALRARWWFIGLVLGSAVFATMLGWFFLFEDYQKNRLTTFLNPDADPLGTGYNITQSLIAVGSGGLWGKGLGQGTQSQLNFLPEATSDFVFAVIAEEYGFIGVALLLLALFIMLFRLWRIMMTSHQPLASLIVLGIAIYLLIQSAMVIGMNMSILPVTGVPLPLVSNGGTSMIVTIILLGLAHRIGQQK